jgi:hypothetical protein
MAGKKPEPNVPGLVYFKEMVSHPVTLVSGMGSIIAGVLVLMVTGTLSFAMLPAMGFFALAAMASLFVPSSPVFRDYIDRMRKAQAREEERALLEAEIESAVGRYGQGNRRSTVEADGYWVRYDRMVSRLESIRKIAETRNTAITSRETERLDQATLDFLRLFHARVILRQRMANHDPKAVDGQLAKLDEQIAFVKNAADKKRLEQAKADLVKVNERATSLQARDSATAASMLSMSDAFEEVYQRIITNPTSGVTETLLEAEQKLSIEEELVSEVDREVEETLLRARRAAAERQTVR